MLKKILLGIESPDEQADAGTAVPISETTMKKVYSSYNEVEWAFIKGILEGEGIPYFVHNEYFGTMQLGTQVSLLNQKTLMVAEKYEDRARGLIGDFLDSIRPGPGVKYRSYSIKDKIRMVVEFFLFGWVMPGNIWSRDKQGPSRTMPREDIAPIIFTSIIVVLIFLFIRLGMGLIGDY
jgi:hypothetical protein